MAPKKTMPSLPTGYSPTTPLDLEHEKRIKAEARAYALSGTTAASAGAKRKSPSAVLTSMAARKTARKSPQHFPPSNPPTLNIHRPDMQYRLHADPAKLIPGAPKSVAKVNLFEGDDDYLRFVKSLNLDDPMFASLENDDEEFHLSDVDEDEEDEDETDLSLLDNQVDTHPLTGEGTPTLSSPLSSPPVQLPDFDTNIYKDLEEELGSLLEEDLEAAVQSLMTSKTPSTPSAIQPVLTPSPTTPKASGNAKTKTSEGRTESPATPLRDAARQGTRAKVTYQQAQQLRRLLTQHYQLLVQQAVLGARAAHMQKLNKEKSDFLSGETSDDLAEILDGAVGMLQDLDQNRKDAIRNSIQLSESEPGNVDTDEVSMLSGRRSLLSKFTESSNGSRQKRNDRRLTRAAFSKTLELGTSGQKRTTFDIPGLVKLKETFEAIDNSVAGIKGLGNILELPTHAEACRMVLRHASANIEEAVIPGVADLADNFSDCRELFGEDFKSPCSEEQDVLLRRNRNLFTSGEDNLVLRGVNLYGEKQWILIADRYLPDRSVNIISQRYSKLCVMLYKAHGIDIDAKGNLLEPPKLESVDDIDEVKVKELKLEKVNPPAILNVHRWSLEEDLTLLKAVPLMGHMWAELGARLIPHRDRGHLRKRYQVLERRVKATVARSSKGGTCTSKQSKWQSSPRKGNTTAVSLKAPSSKVGIKTHKKVASRKPPAAHFKAPPMSIEKAAASLAFLRPPDAVPVPVMPPRQNGVPQKHSYVNPNSPKAPVPRSRSVVPHTGKRSHLSLPVRKLPLAQVPANKMHATKPPTPSKPSWIESSLNEPSSSRAAFEQLVDGTGEDWSQMSRVKKMLENDAESQAADAIVTHLSKSPMRSNLSKLPQMELDTDSMSGLSILQSEASRPTTIGTENDKLVTTSGTSILSKVLEGSSKASDSRKHSGEEPQTRTGANVKLGTDKKNPSQSETSMDSPKKRAPSKSSFLSTPLPPSTPKGQNFFSMTGTPIGLSPGFRPSPAGILRGQNNSVPRTPSVPFSPVADSMMDEFRYCDFRISEESQKQFEGRKSQHDPNPPPLTPSRNSMFSEQLMANDLEAISALNSLSNSPFKPKKAPDRGESKARKNAKKSLFATVVGGVKGKDSEKPICPKQKLEF
eukprot:scaffold5529_cov117-Cylindrotheca_fusiformis.AAC.6